MNDTNQKQLGNILWGIADQLRGAATTEKSSIVQMRAIERCEVSGIAIGKAGSATR